METQLWRFALAAAFGAAIATAYAQQPALPPAPAVPATCFGVVPSTSTFAGTNAPIPTLATTTFTASVSGMGPILWDVDLSTFLTHTSSGDLDITLTSPAGTVVTITTDNGGSFNDNYNGTTWDDNVNDLVTDHVYANSVTATPLSPEGRLAGFRGENPNGTWTLNVTDDAALDSGTLSNWSLGVSTVPTAPVPSTTTFTRSPNLPLPDVQTVIDNMPVSGLGTNLVNVTLYVEILHTFGGDLDITLTSPAGTVVFVTTDNGGSFDNTFNGTLFNPDTPDTVTDHLYVNLMPATLISPEGSFDNFVGQNPNGSWRLTIVDDAGADIGTLVRWDLNLSTCASSTLCTAFCFGDGSGTACPCGNTGSPGHGCGSSLNAAGSTLACSGLASISTDTFVLTGAGMPNSSALYFQGTNQVNSGAGALFGDGLRCVVGSVIRLGTKTNVNGTSSYPGVGDVRISVKGLNVAGGLRRYQCWYRNAAAFCTASTFNVSNGVEVTWIP